MMMNGNESRVTPGVYGRGAVKMDDTGRVIVDDGRLKVGTVADQKRANVKVLNVDSLSGDGNDKVGVVTESYIRCTHGTRAASGEAI